MATLLPPLLVSGSAEHLVVPSELFDRPVADVWLEVGFGSGEHLFRKACAHPDVGLIGCEPYLNGVGALLARIEASTVSTIRIFADDARLLLPRLPDACLGRVFVLFADPWPKRRHHKRRFVTIQTLDALARVLKDEGELRFASDHSGYAAWTLWHVLRHPDLHWIAREARDWRRPPEDWIGTRYEAKAKAQRAACFYLRFLRRRRR